MSSLFGAVPIGASHPGLLECPFSFQKGSSNLIAENGFVGNLRTILKC